MIMGVVLGTLGGGGSVLTVPILVYLCDIPATLASSYSLWIVGVTALVGVATSSRDNSISYQAVIYFGLPSVAGVVLARIVLLPAIPETVLSSGDFLLTRDALILLAFALLMVAAGVAMLGRGPSDGGAAQPAAAPRFSGRKKLFALIEGAFVGLFTGIVGAGGGFIIVPALVMVLRLPIRVAIGTSLAIISLKSILGVAVDTTFWREANWRFLTLFTLASIVGIVLGVLLSGRIPAQPLKRGFGWFVLLLGSFMVAKELFSSS